MEQQSPPGTGAAPDGGPAGRLDADPAGLGGGFGGPPGWAGSATGADPAGSAAPDPPFDGDDRPGKPRRRRRQVVAGFAVTLAFGLVAVAAALAVRSGPAHCDPAAADGCVRVLFVGNSYTSVNDLPGTFAALARSGGHQVDAGMSAPGGATLADHLASAATMGTIRGSRWDVVVLQEQSQVPASSTERARVMWPAARGLAVAIRAASATPVLFATWAHRAGWPEAGLPDYASMQDQVNLAYASLGIEIGVGVAPVGTAWESVERRYREIQLWSDDGIHPSPSGTYLAACVLYATVFRQSPAGLPEAGGLPGPTAELLQRVATAAALGAP